MCYKPIENLITKEKIQLKPFEVPSSIEFLEELPRTKADKVDYNLLEKLANNEQINIKIKKKEL